MVHVWHDCHPPLLPLAEQAGDQQHLPCPQPTEEVSQDLRPHSPAPTPAVKVVDETIEAVAEEAAQTADVVASKVLPPANKRFSSFRFQSPQDPPPHPPTFSSPRRVRRKRRGQLPGILLVLGSLREFERFFFTRT